MPSGINHSSLVLKCSEKYRFTPATLYEKSIQELKAMQDEKFRFDLIKTILHPRSKFYISKKITRRLLDLPGGLLQCFTFH